MKKIPKKGEERGFEYLRKSCAPDRLRCRKKGVALIFQLYAENSFRDKWSARNVSSSFFSLSFFFCSSSAFFLLEKGPLMFPFPYFISSILMALFVDVDENYEN